MEKDHFKVLAIDDNQDNLIALKAIISERLPKSKLFTATNGPKGLEVARNEDPDVILLDIVMPVMDGYAVCRKLKEDDQLQMIPVLFMTGVKTDMQSRIKALETGAEGFLTKPFDELELVTQICAMAKVKEANQFKRNEKQRLAKLLVERTKEIKKELAVRKKAEEELRESEERYRLVVENAGDVILIAQDGIIKFINRRATEILGYSNEEFISRPFSEFIHPEDREMVMEYHLKRLRKETIPEIYSFRVTDRNGNIKYFEINAMVIDFNGKPATLNFIRDITGRKIAEQEVVSLQEQLRQAQKMEAIGRLAGGIAHDFNNLLSVIKGTCQLSLLDLKEGDPLYGNLKDIERSADRAADLTRQLLAFSRRQMMEIRVLDLNDVVKGLEKMLKRIIREDIELVTCLSGNLRRIKGDLNQMEQVIINLVVNARDAMPNGGKLIIETENVELDEEYAMRHIAVKPGSYVMLCVSDTGVGMTKEVQERIFEPFFTTKEIGRGTGLGLSTVYGIVKQSGGNIWVYSEPGQGTTFKIYLPCIDEPLEDYRQEVRLKDAPSGNETVLVIEDEEVVRKLTTRLLKKQGYKVLEAPDGGQALLLGEMYSDPIHLILTDVVLPGMSGWELVKKFQRVHPEAKALYMSGYIENIIFHNGKLREKIEFLQKPFTLENLSRRVREVLDKK